MVTFSTTLPVHSASVGVIKEQFFQSSFVVHCSPCHFAIRHSTPGAVAPVADVEFVAFVLVVIAVEALLHIRLLRNLAFALVADAEVVAGSASLPVLLFAVEAAAVVVEEVLDAVVDIVGAADILE